MQGEEARPKAIPVIKGVKKGGTLSSINWKLGLLGSCNFRIPRRFKPISIAIIEILVVKKCGNLPYICPKNPLKAPKSTSDNIMPLEKLRIFNWLFLFFEPPIYAIVIGNKDNEQGPKLVKRPAKKINKKVVGPGL